MERQRGQPKARKVSPALMAQLNEAGDMLVHAISSRPEVRWNLERAVWAGQAAMSVPVRSGERQAQLDQALKRLDRASRHLLDDDDVDKVFDGIGVRTALYNWWCSYVWPDNPETLLPAQLTRLWPGQESHLIDLGDKLRLSGEHLSAEVRQFLPSMDWHESQRPGDIRRRTGRPVGTGMFASRQEFVRAVATVVERIEATQTRVTQERVAEFFGRERTLPDTSKAQLNRWRNTNPA